MEKLSRSRLFKRDQDIKERAVKHHVCTAETKVRVKCKGLSPPRTIWTLLSHPEKTSAPSNFTNTKRNLSVDKQLSLGLQGAKEVATLLRSYSLHSPLPQTNISPALSMQIELSSADRIIQTAATWRTTTNVENIACLL